MKTCQYKINEDVHIGRSVRKTKGPDTVKYRNLPFKNAKIAEFDNDGFTLSHSQFPQDI